MRQFIRNDIYYFIVIYVCCCCKNLSSLLNTAPGSQLVTFNTFISCISICLGQDVEAGGFANIEFCPDSSVEGCVYCLTPPQLESLDKFMGCPEVRQKSFIPLSPACKKPCWYLTSFCCCYFYYTIFMFSLFHISVLREDHAARVDGELHWPKWDGRGTVLHTSRRVHCTGQVDSQR